MKDFARLRTHFKLKNKLKEKRGVNAEDINCIGVELSAVAIEHSKANLDLKVGHKVWFNFKANNVIFRNLRGENVKQNQKGNYYRNFWGYF